MTREEVISRLKVLTDYEYDEDLEALEIAIEALEQELILLDKFKQAREKIDEMSRYTSVTGVTQYKQLNRDDVLEILDELIESEG